MSGKKTSSYFGCTLLRADGEEAVRCQHRQVSWEIVDPRADRRRSKDDGWGLRPGFKVTFLKNKVISETLSSEIHF